MSKTHILQSAIEIIIAAAIVIAYINSDKLAEWEHRQWVRFVRWQRRLRRAIIAFGDTLWGEPVLIGEDGREVPVKKITEQENMS